MSVIGSALYKFEGDASGLTRAAEAGQKSIQKVSEEQTKYNKVQQETTERSKAASLAFTALGAVVAATAARFTTLAFQTGSISRAAQTLGQDFLRIGSSIKSFGETAFRFITSGQLTASIVSLTAKLGAMGKIALEGFEAIATGGLSLLAPFRSIVKGAELLGLAFGGLSIALSTMGGAAALIAPIFAQISGSTLLLIGVLDFLLIKVGQLISSFGGRLVASATQFLHVANEVQREMFGLQVAVEGYQRATKDASVSTAEFVAIVTKLSSTTTISRAELSRGVLTMLDMAQVTGVNAEQIAVLTERAADFAAVTGVDFQTVIYGIDQAMRGFPRVAASMGLALNEAELAQTHFVQALGKGVDQLTLTERATAFYELIVEKTAFTVGKSAAAAQETFSGAIQATESRLRNIHAEIGKGVQAAWFPFQKIVLDIVTSIEQGLNPAIFHGIGGFLAIVGPVAQFTGGLVEVSAKLALVAFGISLVLKAFPALQVGLLAVIARLGIATTSFAAFSASILGLLANPVVIGLAVLAAAIVGVSVAVGILGQKTKTLTEQNAELFSEFRRLSDQAVLSIEDMKRMDEIINELSKSYPGLRQAIDTMNLSLKETSKLVSEIHIGQLGMQADEINRQIIELKKQRDAFIKSTQEGMSPESILTSGLALDQIDSKIEELQKKALDVSRALKATEEKVVKQTVEEFLTEMNIELGRTKVQFEVLNTMSRESFVQELEKQLVKVIDKANTMQTTMIKTVNDISNPELKKQAIDLFTQIHTITHRTNQNVEQFLIRLREMRGEFDGPTGAIRRQIVEQQRLIADLKRGPVNPQSKTELFFQEQVLQGLKNRYAEIMKEMSSQTRLFTESIMDAEDESQAFGNVSLAFLRREAKLAADDFRTFAFSIDKNYIEIADELIGKTDGSKESIGLLKSAVTDFGEEAFDGMSILKQKLDEVSGEGKLSGFSAVAEAIKRTKFAVQDLVDVGAKLFREEAADAEAKGASRAGITQKDVDLQKELDRLRNLDLADQQRVNEQKIQDLIKLNASSEIIERVRLQQSAAIRDEELRRARQTLDNKLIKDRAAEEQYLIDFRDILQRRGEAELEIERTLEVERDRLRQERLAKEAQVAQATINNAQTISEAVKGIANKVSVEWKQTFGNLGFVTEQVFNIMSNSLSNTLGKVFRGEIKSFEDFFKDFLKGMADAWLNAIQQIISKLITLWLWQTITKVASSFSGNAGTATAGTGGAGIGNDGISGGFTAATASSGVLAGRIPSIANQSGIATGKPMMFYGSYAMGAEMGPIPSGTNRPVPILAHPNEMIFNENQQMLMAAALRGEGPQKGSGEKVTNIEIIFAKDLQEALRQPDPDKIVAIVNSNILRSGSVRKTIRQTR